MSKLFALVCRLAARRERRDLDMTAVRRALSRLAMPPAYASVHERQVRARDVGIVGRALDVLGGE